jgi:hypothetical protein
MKMSAGKGDKPRNCFSKKYKENYDDINWNKKSDCDNKLKSNKKNESKKRS